MKSINMNGGPHQNQRIFTAGKKPTEAEAAMILLHGRGASAPDILMMAEELDRPEFSYLAPQAAGFTWYPYRFVEPKEKNEPGLSSGLKVIDDLIRDLNHQGISHERIMLLGFSQGACLALEYAASHARQYGGIFGLSGGLIGPPGTEWNYEGSFQNTLVFLGCSENDFHIPKKRVEESAEVFKRLNASVTLKFYPGTEHTINQDEIKTVQDLLDHL